MTRNILIILLLVGWLLNSCKQKQAATNAAEMNMVQLQKQHPVNELIISNDPRKTDITIEFNSASAGNGVLVIYSSHAAVIGHKIVYVNKGMNTWHFDFPQRATGLYFVRLKINNIERSAKVFKNY